jgi:hypothetical protein
LAPIAVGPYFLLAPGTWLSGAQLSFALLLGSILRRHLKPEMFEASSRIGIFSRYTPLRLRAENQLGYKMVKWIERIEFIESEKTLGQGEGGENEDGEYFDLPNIGRGSSVCPPSSTRKLTRCLIAATRTTGLVAASLPTPTSQSALCVRKWLRHNRSFCLLSLGAAIHLCFHRSGPTAYLLFFARLPKLSARETRFSAMV